MVLPGNIYSVLHLRYTAVKFATMFYVLAALVSVNNNSVLSEGYTQDRCVNGNE